MSPSTSLPGQRLRMLIAFAILLAGLLLMVAKAGRLQLGLGGDLKELAEQQYVRSLRFSAPRGNVYDREGRPLAVSVPVWSVSASPRVIEDPRAIATALGDVLGLEPQRLGERLTGKGAFIWLKRRVPPEVAERIRKLAIDGVGLHRESKRFYPGHKLAGQLLGTVSIDGDGQSGVERAYDTHLRGRSISLPGLQDNRGRRALMSGAVDLEVLGGDDVYLTVDARLQHTVENALLRGLERTEAHSGMAVVVDPRSGAVLAVANAPRFNPNRPGAARGARRNQAFSDMFEPGSTFKAFAFAAAIDGDVVKPGDRIFCENGRYKLGRHTVHDTHPEGWLTARDVFKFSSNIGTLKITRRLGEQGFRDALERFGFGEKPGLGFVEESRGMLPRKKRWGEVRLATISYGHGISVTALQLAQALSVLANDGVRAPMHLLSRVEAPSGEIALEPDLGDTERVIRSETAKTVTEIMTSVFEKGGTGYSARIDGVVAAGKTGTAEKVDPRTGRYTKEAHTSSFMGFAPAVDPEFVVVVVLDDPQGRVSGGATAGPIWREIMTAALIDGGHPLTPLEPEDKGAAGTGGEHAGAAASSDGHAKVDPRFADFIGLNAREAIREADARGVEAAIEGGGTVRRVELSTREDGARVLLLQLGQDR